MTLEEQIKALDAIGISLSDEATVEDLLLSFDRKEFEREPFVTLLFMLGIEIEREPWGRPFSRVAWNFDAECINDDGDYVSVLEGFARLAGRLDELENVSDSVDLDSATATLNYTIAGRTRDLKPKVDNDWVDQQVVATIQSDLEHAGRRFYGIDNGQATIYYFIDAETAMRLETLTGIPVSPPMSSNT